MQAGASLCTIEEKAEVTAYQLQARIGTDEDVQYDRSNDRNEVQWKSQKIVSNTARRK